MKRNGIETFQVYLIGSLKDPNFPVVAAQLRAAGVDIFDDWRGGGYDGDARWRHYELEERGRGYIEALRAPFAMNNRDFDINNLHKSSAVVAVCKPRQLPGRSSVSELAYAKFHLQIPAYVLLNGEPEDWDLMLPLSVTNIFNSVDDLLKVLK